MPYPPANQGTVLNIARCLLGVEDFYEKVCDLMHEMMLPLPFTEEEDFPEFNPKPKYLFHTIYDFVSAKVNELIAVQNLNYQAIEVLSQVLNYFREKQLKEYQENAKINRISMTHNLVSELSEVSYRIAAASELENLKPIETPRKIPKTSFECRAPNFLSKEDIKTQCLPLDKIPHKILSKCKEEPPSKSLYLYNLPKSVSEDQVLKLIRHAFSNEYEMKRLSSLELLQGRLKGQGFLHLDSVERAAFIKDSLFGFPLLEKPLILVKVT